MTDLLAAVVFGGCAVAIWRHRWFLSSGELAVGLAVTLLSAAVRVALFVEGVS